MNLSTSLSSFGDDRRRVVGIGAAAAAARLVLAAALPNLERIADVSWGVVPTTSDKTVAAVLLALCAGGLMFGLCRALRDAPLPALGLAALVLLVGAGLRFLVLDCVTGDYMYFLSPWADTFRAKGWQAITADFADYNMPYLYIVSIIAKIPVHDLFLYKIVSIAFDCGLVLASLRLGRALNLSPLRRVAVACAVWIAPTVLLNSAYWAQCDSIYVFFVIMALSMAIEDKPVFSMVFAAVAFSFKLQTIFFLPVYLVFWMAKKIKLWHFAVFPATYILTVLPAWVSGKSFEDILGVYMGQTKTYADYLNLNSPSGYALVKMDEGFHDLLFMTGTVLAVCFVAAVTVFMLLRRSRIDRRSLLICALLLSAGIPWLLPSMHERYFYISDILCIITAAVIPKRWYLAALGVFASYACYHCFLFGALPYIGTVIPSFFMLFVIGTAAYELWEHTSLRAANTDRLGPVH